MELVNHESFQTFGMSHWISQRYTYTYIQELKLKLSHEKTRRSLGGGEV
jgi:hypothetical protein